MIDTAPLARPTADDVAAMARAIGIEIEPDRLPLVAERLAEMLELASAIDAIELDGVAPDCAFDPSWTNVTTGPAVVV